MNLPAAQRNPNTQLPNSIGTDPSQKIGLFDLTMIVIGLVIGMGIFRTSRDAAVAALVPSVFFAAWIVGGAVAVCGALTYAEIGSRFPVTGGYYRIFAVAYHPSIAFAINGIILISNAASLAGVALIGSEYAAPFILPHQAADLSKAVLAMGTILVFYGVNLLGLRMSTRALNVLMAVKIGMILVIILAIILPDTHNASPLPVAGGSGVGWCAGIIAFGTALKATSFTYGGYQQTINFGGEVRSPKQTTPRGILIGITVVILLYLSASVAYYKVIGFEELKTTSGIAAVVAERMFGAAGSRAVSVLLFLAVSAYVNVLLLSNPRVMVAMSEDGILPEPFRRRDEKRGVPIASLSAFAAACLIVLFFANTFEKILSFTIFLDSIGMATSAATIFSLRKKTRHLDGTGIYAMRFYPLLPLCFVCAYLFVGAVIALTHPRYAVTGIVTLIAFLGIFFATERFRTQQP